MSISEVSGESYFDCDLYDFNPIEKNHGHDVQDSNNSPNQIILQEEALIRSRNASFRRLKAENALFEQLAKKQMESVNALSDVLIKYGNNSEGIPALLFAAKKGDENAVRLLIKFNVEQNIDKSVVLDSAIQSKSLPLVKYLVEEEMYATASALSSSIRYDFFEGFDYFLGKGCEIPKDIILTSIYANSAKFLEAYGLGSNMDRINFLLSRGASISCIEDNPCSLNSAITANDFELMKFLLKYGAYKKVNTLSWNEHPLHFILCLFPVNLTTKIEWLNLIFDSGLKIDPKFKDQIWEDFQPCYLGKGNMNKQSADVLRSLINNGFPLDYAGTIEAGTLLYYAVALWTDYDLVEALLKNGVDPNFHTNDALKVAIHQANAKIVALLVSYGAKLDEI